MNGADSEARGNSAGAGELGLKHSPKKGNRLEDTMIHYSTAGVTILLTLAAAGGTAAQETRAVTDEPAATNDTSGMVGDKTKNAESAPPPSTPLHDSFETRMGADTIGT